MKIGISASYYFRKFDDTQSLYRLKSHGYDAVDFNLLTNTNQPIYHCSEAQFVHTLTGIRDRAADAGVLICQTHGPWRYPPQDATEEDRAERFEKMVKGIRATSILGAKYFVIHPLMPFGPGQDPEPERLWEMNREFLGRLARVGGENGVVVCLENMPMRALSVSTPEKTLQMVKELDSPWMRVCLDTGHAAVFGISPGDAVRQIGKEYLAVLHVHDNDGNRDLHQLPYTGVIDWAAFSAALHEIGFDGVVSLETGVSSGFHLPPDMVEYYEKGLANIARRLTERPE